MVCACCFAVVCRVFLSRCGVGVCGRECAGGGTRFMKFRGAGVCKRTGTVKFHILPVRYGA